MTRAKNSKIPGSFSLHKECIIHEWRDHWGTISYHIENLSSYYHGCHSACEQIELTTLFIQNHDFSGKSRISISSKVLWCSCIWPLTSAASLCLSLLFVSLLKRGKLTEKASWVFWWQHLFLITSIGNTGLCLVRRLVLWSKICREWGNFRVNSGCSVLWSWFSSYCTHYVMF